METVLENVRRTRTPHSDSKKPALAEAVKELGARDGVGVKQQVVEAPRGLTFDDGQQSFKVAALTFLAPDSSSSCISMSPTDRI